MVSCCQPASLCGAHWLFVCGLCKPLKLLCIVRVLWGHVNVRTRIICHVLNVIWGEVCIAGLREMFNKILQSWCLGGPKSDILLKVSSCENCPSRQPSQQSSLCLSLDVARLKEQQKSIRAFGILRTSANLGGRVTTV